MLLVTLEEHYLRSLLHNSSESPLKLQVVLLKQISVADKVRTAVILLREILILMLNTNTSFFHCNINNMNFAPEQKGSNDIYMRDL